MQMRHFIFLSFALLAGCNFDPQTDSSGELGNARFAYSGAQCELFTCPMDKNALLGSMVTVVATGDRARPPVHAMFANQAVGRIIDSRPDCGADSSACQYSVDIATTGAGDGELQL